MCDFWRPKIQYRHSYARGEDNRNLTNGPDGEVTAESSQDDRTSSVGGRSLTHTGTAAPGLMPNYDAGTDYSYDFLTY